MQRNLRGRAADLSTASPRAITGATQNGWSSVFIGVVGIWFFGFLTAGCEPQRRWPSGSDVLIAAKLVAPDTAFIKGNVLTCAPGQEAGEPRLVCDVCMLLLQKTINETKDASGNIISSQAKIGIVPQVTNISYKHVASIAQPNVIVDEKQVGAWVVIPPGGASMYVPDTTYRELTGAELTSLSLSNPPTPEQFNDPKFLAATQDAGVMDRIAKNSGTCTAHKGKVSATGAIS